MNKHEVSMPGGYLGPAVESNCENQRESCGWKSLLIMMIVETT